MAKRRGQRTKRIQRGRIERRRTTAARQAAPARAQVRSPAPVRGRAATKRRRAGGESKQLGFAVVGLGNISQGAVLPAFAHADRAKLVALVSSNDEKLQKLGRRYKVKHRFHYDEFEQCLALPEVDAVYIALPNDQHAEFTERAAAAGKHVLCEKPMEVSEGACRRMIRACDDAGVKLMIAYRLHFEPGNLEAIDLIERGKLGELKFFSSDFSYQVKPRNIRTGEPERGGGPTWDIGIYCINAARYLFRADPIEVFAFATRGKDERFSEIEETMSCVMRFSSDRLATFNVSYGSAPTGAFRIVGTKGELFLDNAYEYVGGKKLTVTIDEKPKEKRFKEVDQFAPELDYFAECIARNVEPEPDGYEGLMDVRIIRAIHESARHGRPVRIEPLEVELRRPSKEQKYEISAVKTPELVDAEKPAQ